MHICCLWKGAAKPLWVALCSSQELTRGQLQLAVIHLVLPMLLLLFLLLITRVGCGRRRAEREREPWEARRLVEAGHANKTGGGLGGQ